MEATWDQTTATANRSTTSTRCSRPCRPRSSPPCTRCRRRTALIEVVLDLGRRPEARFPDSEVDAARSRDRRGRHRLRRRAHRHVRRRQPGRHRADAPPDQRHPQPDRQGRRADLPHRAGRLRHDRDHRRLRRDREVDPDHGPAGHRQDDDAARGRPRPRRRPGQARRRRRHRATRSPATATSRTRRSARRAGCRSGRRRSSTR